MSKVNITNGDEKMEKIEEDEFAKAIRAARDKLYQQAYEDAKDTEGEGEEARTHLEREYSNCDVEELIDTIRDKVLDSFGS